MKEDIANIGEIKGVLRVQGGLQRVDGLDPSNIFCGRTLNIFHPYKFGIGAVFQPTPRIFCYLTYDFQAITLVLLQNFKVK